MGWDVYVGLPVSRGHVSRGHVSRGLCYLCIGDAAVADITSYQPC